MRLIERDQRMKSNWFKTVCKIFLIELVIAVVLLMTIANEVMKNRKYEAENYGATIATNIELLLNQYVSIVESLGDQYLEYGEDFAPSFPRICQHIMERDSTVGSLYIAPNGIIQMAYPQSVNEATIGFKPAESPEQGPATRLAIESKKATVAGPHALIEGGTGFIVRYPIYSNEDQFIGLAILVMDWDRFVQTIRAEDHGNLYHYAVWKENTEGTLTDENGFIFSDGEIRKRDIQIAINAPNETWYLTVEEKDQWSGFRRMLPWVLGTAVFLAVLTYIEYSVIRSREIRRKSEMAEAENRAKQEEMERRLALKEQLLEQDRQRKEQDSLINALASDYHAIFYIDLDRDSGICYQGKDGMSSLKTGERFVYSEASERYARRHVKEEDQQAFLDFIRIDNLRARLEKETVISHRFIIRVQDREVYEILRYAGIQYSEEAGKQVVHTVSAGFLNVDEETRKEIDRQKVLAEALAAAEEANRAKTIFLSNMSHEIRTPMNAIIGLDNLALNEKGISKTTRTYLEKIGSSARHLLGIINDILDMSRIESGRMSVRSEEFSLAETLEQVNTIISGQCREKGVIYDFLISGEVDEYYIGDAMKLRQVLINILGNAVKFTPRDGTVTFTVERVARMDERSTLRFTVRDTGHGISREFLPKIFEPFSQEETSLTNRTGSTGLGMPITKNIVELMDGQIDVESEKNVGTTFTVTLTLRDSDWNSDADGHGLPRMEEMDVLLVDDDPESCEQALQILSQAGITCEKAGSSSEGMEMVRLRHARREPYSLILVDHDLSGDSVIFARKIHEAAEEESILILLTARSPEEMGDQANPAGIDAVISKPLSLGKVLTEFRRAFMRKREMMTRKPAELKGRRILLAEDVEVNAEIMIMVLNMRGMEADRAENGRIAVELYEQHEAGYYDAILMDMRMPEMDGLEATRTIRTSGRPDAETIPIIALTANAFDEDVKRSMQAGLNAHLTKPVEPEVLYKTLEKLIRD